MSCIVQLLLSLLYYRHCRLSCRWHCRSYPLLLLTHYHRCHCRCPRRSCITTPAVSPAAGNVANAVGRNCEKIEWSELKRTGLSLAAVAAILPELPFPLPLALLLTPLLLMLSLLYYRSCHFPCHYCFRCRYYINSAAAPLTSLPILPLLLLYYRSCRWHRRSYRCHYRCWIAAAAAAYLAANMAAASAVAVATGLLSLPFLLPLALSLIPLNEIVSGANSKLNQQTKAVQELKWQNKSFQ